MRQRIDGAPSLVPIAPTADERARMDALHSVAKALTVDPRFRAHPLVVKGGTGLALAYGLPRPSTDLDLTCFGRVDKARVLEAAVTALSETRRRKFLRTDIKQRGHGYLRLHWEDETAAGARRIETKIDVNTGDPLAVPDNWGMHNGFRVFSLRTLAWTKLNTLVEEDGVRERARDLYDAAWLMETHMDCVSARQRVALWEVVRGLVLERCEQWTLLFERVEDTLAELQITSSSADQDGSDLLGEPVDPPLPGRFDGLSPELIHALKFAFGALAISLPSESAFDLIRSILGRVSSQRCAMDPEHKAQESDQQPPSNV